jgi:FkbM family methyltransferase|tara:strand:- start:691 stop:1404 length:714 start_codon:yes stop_codon:yes gene_type:complete
MNIIIKLIKLIKNKTWRKGLYKNIAANIELENIIKALDIDIIIDIGSNKGQFILLTEKLLNCKKIYSFEPIKELIEKQKKFFSYRDDINFYNFALGQKTEKKKFFLTKRKDSSSFLKINENIDNDDYLIENEINVNIHCLDNIINNQDLSESTLVKIDVQGYELEVLKGSLGILKKIKYILIEVSENEIYKNQALSSDIINFLKQKNFSILRENKSTKIKKTNLIQKDILLINDSIS